MKTFFLNISKLISVSIIFLGCSNPKSRVETPISNYTEYSTTGRGSSTLSVITIDSCEYIGYLGGTYSDVLTHKGNCKFCLDRNSKK